MTLLDGLGDQLGAVAAAGAAPGLVTVSAGRLPPADGGDVAEALRVHLQVRVFLADVIGVRPSRARLVRGTRALQPVVR